ncbi:MAG: thermonuclease family protein [Candidatus Moraniibacteriota bacterium]
MRRSVWISIVVGLLVLSVGIGIGLWRGKVNEIDRHGVERRMSGTGTIIDPQNTNGRRQPEDSFVGEYGVARVIDGDTIEIEGGERVRYIGMDTPETVDPEKSVQCFGKEASDENKRLVEGKTVRLEKDTNDRDQYGRLLRYVYVGDTFVNLDLVRLGFAYATPYPPDILHQDWFAETEQSAKDAGLGLWGACSLR